MIDEEQIKGFFQKNYGKALNEYQIAVIKAIMENAQEPDKAHCIRVGASAGSGKTTLILFAFLTLVKFCGVNPHEIVILTLNTRVAQGGCLGGVRFVFCGGDGVFGRVFCQNRQCPVWQ